MMVYETLLIIGALGLAAMTLMGFVHGGHHGGQGHGHGAGHAIDVQHGGTLDAAGAHGGAAGAHGHVAPGHVHHGSGHAAGPHGHGDGHGVHHIDADVLFELLSPLTLFSLALGAGATGVILQSIGFSRGAAALPAVLGAGFFYVAILRPLRSLIFSFASKPAQTLEGALMQEAEVVTSFNAHGEGIVRLVVDGQSVDVLARLEAAENSARVLRGQRVLVEDVDAHRNMVRVSRL